VDPVEFGIIGVIDGAVGVIDDTVSVVGSVVGVLGVIQNVVLSGLHILYSLQDTLRFFLVLLLFFRTIVVLFFFVVHNVFVIQFSFFCIFLINILYICSSNSVFSSLVVASLIDIAHSLISLIKISLKKSDCNVGMSEVCNAFRTLQKNNKSALPL
jgi:hypothetical protein